MRVIHSENVFVTIFVAEGFQIINAELEAVVGIIVNVLDSVNDPVLQDETTDFERRIPKRKEGVS